VDIGATVDLIGELLPDMSNIFIVAGNSMTDRKVIKLTRLSLRGKSHVERLNKALDDAKEKGWTLVDMKNDWKRVFPIQKTE
jgi:hypothetical protein